MKSYRLISRLRIVLGLLLAVPVLLTNAPALAASPHEDPEAAKPIYNSISLLNYYRDSLDFVLKKNANEVEARLRVMPFAYVPETMKKATGSFSDSGVSVAHYVQSIDEGIRTLRSLLSQFRNDRALQLSIDLFSNLAQAYDELDKLENAAEGTSDILRLEAAPQGSPVVVAYGEVTDRIHRIRDMLDLFGSLLASSQLQTMVSSTPPEQAAAVASQLETASQKLKEQGASQELIEQLRAVIQALNSPAITPEQAAAVASELETATQKLKEQGISIDLPRLPVYRSLLPTSLTLQLDPMVAFVGDEVRFEGILTSTEGPLAGKQIDILLNGSPYVTVKTGADGHYDGILNVPYWYDPQIEVQAIFYPRQKDEAYLSSLSPILKLTVLFYQAVLSIHMPDKAYPGLETTVTGSFDYGQAPPSPERKVHIALGEAFLGEDLVSDTFTEKIMVPPDVDTGQLTVTVSAPSSGRYSPVVAAAALNVTKAVPVLDLDIPAIAIIPGSIMLNGKLHSELGALGQASVRLTLDKAEGQATSSPDGAFESKLSMGMGLGLIGSQPLEVLIIPREPWHARLAASRRIVLVNVVNVGVVLAFLALCGVYLPWRMRKRPARPRPVRRQETPQLSPQPRLNWYRLVLELVQKLNGVVGAVLAFLALCGAYLLWRMRKRPARPRPVRRQETPQLSPQPNLRYDHEAPAPAGSSMSGAEVREPRRMILNWYRLVLKLVQKLTGVVLHSHQTLREFVNESSRPLGRAAVYLRELTRLVEKLLYSPYVPTESDIDRSKELSEGLDMALKPGQRPPARVGPGDDRRPA